MFMFTGWVFVCVLVWFGGAWIYSSLSLVWETAHMVMVTVQGAPPEEVVVSVQDTLMMTNKLMRRGDQVTGP